MDKKIPKIAISGYYGFDNCGDEAVLLAIIRCLRKLEPCAEITVFSGAPAATREAYGVKAAYRWNPFSMAYRILACDLLISGGGSLIQDVTSSRNVSYYLGVVNLAQFLGKKVMIYSQGVGPLSIEKNRKKTAKTLSRCSLVTVRDSSSETLLRDIGYKGEIRVVSDPVMALCREDVESEDLTDLLQKAGYPDAGSGRRKPLLMASVRRWKDDGHFAPIAKELDKQIRRGWDVLLVPAHFPDDEKAIDSVAELMSEKPYVISVRLTAREFLALAAFADKVFSMRLHGLIGAMAMETPMFGVSYDPKVDAFMEQAGMSENCRPYDDLDVGDAESLFGDGDAPAEEDRRERSELRSKMYAKAWGTAQQAIELLKK